MAYLNFNFQRLLDGLDLNNALLLLVQDLNVVLELDLFAVQSVSSTNIYES